MSRAHIPGRLDYRALAELHRPRDPDALEAEVRRLHSTGLMAVDVSIALRMPLDDVVNIVSPQPVSTP